MPVWAQRLQWLCFVGFALLDEPLYATPLVHAAIEHGRAPKRNEGGKESLVFNQGE